MGDIVIGRRGFLVGAGGVLALTGCGSSGGEATGTTSSSPTPSGPVINGKDAGTVVGTEELQALVAALDAAVVEQDLDTLVRLLKVERFQRPELEQRLRSITTVPLAENHFYVTAPTDRMVNSSGGAVPFDAFLVLTHQIPDCDAYPVAQSYGIQLVKAGPEAPLEVVRWLGRAQDRTSPLPWEMTSISSATSRHATILTRSRDLDELRRFLPLADAGAVAAMAAVPPPKGVSKVAFTLAWDQESDEKVFGPWRKTIDRSAFCAHVGFLDPQGLADGTSRPQERFEPGRATSGRILMRRSSRESDAGFQETACHEAVHALAGQWGSARSWVSEGLAEWVSSGYSSGVRARAAGVVRSGFPAFAAGVVKDDFEFQAERTSSRNYQCSAAVFSWVEETRGRDEAVGLARRCYQSDDEDRGVRRALGRSFPEVLQEVATWLPRW